MNRSQSAALLAPLLCAVHCMATPVLVVAAPALAPTPRLEWGFFAVSIVLVAGAMLRANGVSGPLPRAWIAILPGLGIWAASLSSWFEPVPESLTTLAGAVLISGGLLWNARSSQRLPCDCTPGDCGEPRDDVRGVRARMYGGQPQASASRTG